MAPQVKFKPVWTEPAVCVVERIDRYLRRRNPAAALQLGEGLLERVQTLETHPEIGRVYDPELPDRVLLHHRYKVFYRVSREKRMVEIAHVRHAARDNLTADDLLTD